MSAPLDWNQLATLIGLAGIISGGVSAGINYLVENRKEKEKRGAEVAKEQIELYSAFYYNLGIFTAAWRSFFSQDREERKAAKKPSKILQIKSTHCYRIRFIF